MPLEQFGLRFPPFTPRPESGFVPVAARAEPLARLQECLTSGHGIALLTAAPGLGKSTLCRELARRMHTEWLTAVLHDAGVTTRRSLLQAILYELDLPYGGLTEQEARLRLLQTIRDRQPQQAALVLLVDEAQRLSDRLLAELRALINHEQDGFPLVRLLLSGDHLLEERLLDPALASVHQRIACHEILQPLSQEESAWLIDGRVTQAGGDGWEHVFTRTAMELICLVSDGCPRNLEQLAHRSLTLADAARETRVSVDTVRAALKELRELPLQWNEPSNLEAYTARERSAAAASAADSPSFAFDPDLTMTTRDDVRTSDDAVSVVVGDELPTVQHPSRIAMASIEIGEPTAEAALSNSAGADAVPPGHDLDLLFTRGGVETHALFDEEPAAGLEDTAVLQGEAGLHAAAPAHATPLWDEMEVDDRYAALDSLRTPASPTIATPAPRSGTSRAQFAEPPAAAPRLEQQLLDEVQSLSAAVRGSLSLSAVAAAETDRWPRPADEPPATEADAAPASWERAPEWDVIQPEWVFEEVDFQPIAIDLSSRAIADAELPLPPACAAEPAANLTTAPDAGPQDHAGAFTAAAPDTAEWPPLIRVDPGADRPYSQLFSRLRRLRASVGERFTGRPAHRSR